MTGLRPRGAEIGVLDLLNRFGIQNLSLLITITWCVPSLSILLEVKFYKPVPMS